MCSHEPACPDIHANDSAAPTSRPTGAGPGWCRLCNGIILFDDGHYLTPDGKDLLISA